MIFLDKMPFPGKIPWLSSYRRPTSVLRAHFFNLTLFKVNSRTKMLVTNLLAHPCIQSVLAESTLRGLTGCGGPCIALQLKNFRNCKKILVDNCNFNIFFQVSVHVFWPLCPLPIFSWPFYSWMLVRKLFILPFLGSFFSHSWLSFEQSIRSCSVQMTLFLLITWHLWPFQYPPPSSMITEPLEEEGLYICSI